MGKRITLYVTAIAILVGVMVWLAKRPKEVVLKNPVRHLLGSDQGRLLLGELTPTQEVPAFENKSDAALIESLQNAAGMKLGSLGGRDRKAMTHLLLIEVLSQRSGIRYVVVRHGTPALQLDEDGALCKVKPTEGLLASKTLWTYCEFAQ